MNVVDKHYVRRVAEKHITSQLPGYEKVAKRLFKTPQWDKWLDLCTERTNNINESWARLNNYDLRRMSMNKFTADDFIEKAAMLAAQVQLSKMAFAPKFYATE